MSQKKVLLAYSGGLDTSCIMVWLMEKGYEVTAFLANVGQDEDFEAARDKAYKLGAKKFICPDLRKDFVENYIWPYMQANVAYEGRYLMGTALARPCIARALVETAKKEGISYISHGATGKGNDQVRFELCCYALYPGVEIIAPWKIKEFYDRFPGRPELFEYASIKDIPLPVVLKAPYSIDSNIMHTSYEGGKMVDPSVNPQDLEGIYMMTTNPRNAPDEPDSMEIHWKNGKAVRVKSLTSDEEYDDVLDIFNFVNKIGSKHGVGRIDIVENRFTGMKSRGLYETPGGTVLFHAHLDIEVLTMDREVQKIKRYLATKFTEQIYEGYWFSPEGKFTRHCIDKSQENVEGVVQLSVYKGNVTILSRSSPLSLYNVELVSMEEHGPFDPQDSKGFIKINAVRLIEYQKVHSTKTENP